MTAAAEETDAKVRRALSVFEALRSAMGTEESSTSTVVPRGIGSAAATSSSTSPAPSPVAQKLVRRRKVGGKKMSSGAVGDVDADTYTYTSTDTLETMDTDALRHRLVTAEALLRRLHQQHRALEHKLVFTESQYAEQGRKLQRLETADADLEARVNQQCKAREADLRAHQEAALTKLQARHQQELATLSRRHEAAQRELQAALDDARAQRTEALRASATADTSVARELQAERSNAAATKAERDRLKATVAALEARLAASAPRSADDRHTAPVSHRSECISALQDQVTTLEFRLKQLQLHCTDLESIQLAAILNGDTPATDSSTTKKSLNSLINQEVRKLFECLKRRMTADAVIMEAERSRLNELLYGLEQRLASRDG